MSTTDAVERAQNAFDQQHELIKARHKAIKGQAEKRKAFAYIAKIIAAVSGLLMTLDAVKPYNVPVGVLISVMVTLDYVFSNQAKLLVFTQAEQAYRRLMENLAHMHNVKMPRLLPLREKSPEKFAEELITLLEEMLNRLHAKRTEIEDAINAADIKALTRLAIDTA